MNKTVAVFDKRKNPMFGDFDGSVDYTDTHKKIAYLNFMSTDAFYKKYIKTLDECAYKVEMSDYIYKLDKLDKKVYMSPLKGTQNREPLELSFATLTVYGENDFTVYMEVLGVRGTEFSLAQMGKASNRYVGFDNAVSKVEVGAKV